MEDRNAVAPLVARLSQVVAARLEDIAAEAGVSYHTLSAWARGRRSANSRHLLRLAEVVRHRAQLLQELAAELEAQAAELPVDRRGAHSRFVQGLAGGQNGDPGY